MSGDERRRMCSVCQECVHDVSHLSLKEISENYVDSNKCVKMSSDQTEFFHYFKSMSKVAGLTAALSLFTFANAYGQDQIPEGERCTVYGKVKSNSISNRTVFVIVDGKTYQAISNSNGRFKLEFPKGQKIEDSNIRKLQNKTVKKEELNLRKVRLPKIKFFIGTPHF